MKWFKKAKKNQNCCGVQIKEVKDEKSSCCNVKIEELEADKNYSEDQEPIKLNLNSSCCSSKTE